MKFASIIAVQIFILVHVACANYDNKKEVEQSNSNNVEALEECDNTECLEKHKKDAQEKRNELKALLQEIKNLKTDINDAPNQNEEKIVDDSSTIIRSPNNKVSPYFTVHSAVKWLLLLIDKNNKKFESKYNQIEQRLKTQEENGVAVKQFLFKMLENWSFETSIEDRFNYVEECLKRISDYLEKKHNDSSCETDSEESEGGSDDEDDQQ